MRQDVSAVIQTESNETTLAMARGRRDPKISTGRRSRAGEGGFSFTSPPGVFNPSYRQLDFVERWGQTVSLRREVIARHACRDFSPGLDTMELAEWSRAGRESLATLVLRPAKSGAPLELRRAEVWDTPQG